MRICGRGSRVQGQAAGRTGVRGGRERAGRGPSGCRVEGAGEGRSGDTSGGGGEEKASGRLPLQRGQGGALDGEGTPRPGVG